MTRFGLNWRAMTAEAFPDLFHPQKALVATSSFVDADPGSPWGQGGMMAHAQDWRAEFMRAHACLFETATYETRHAPGQRCSKKVGAKCWSDSASASKPLYGSMRHSIGSV